MRLRTLILIGVIVAFAASAACAGTVYMNTSQLAANGWSTTLKTDSDGRGAVGDRVQTGFNGIQFTGGDKEKTSRCWATISTAAFDNVLLSQITTLQIKVWGHEGDGTAWQPPTFFFALKKEPANLSNRFVMWVPWTNGNARSVQTWNTYDAMTTGQWICPWVNGTYNSLAALSAAYPNLAFATAEEIKTMDSGYLGKSFNVGYADWLSQASNYTDSARGTVDWFTVGVNNVNTTYDLNDAPVPEPCSMIALTTGLVGLVGLRRRMAK